MSCNAEITRGFTLDCRDSIGGIRSIMVAELSAVEDYTVSDGEVTAITLADGKNFHKYELRKQTGDFTETIENNDETGTLYFEQELNFQLTRMEAAKRNEIFLVAKADVVVIVEDRNGKYWLLGAINGLILSGNSTSGTAMGDLNGYELTFTGQEEEPALEVDSDIISDLLSS